MPFQVVLNYRRGDAAGNAGRLYEALAARFGEDNVFMDIDTIEPGLDFVEVIERAVGSCDVFLAMIGQHWLTISDGSGRRRLDDPADFVRMEIEAALRRKIRLIPVLVQDVEMPSPEDLPEPLAPLARRNAIDIRDSTWRYDVDRLIQTLERIAQQQPEEAGAPGREGSRRQPPPEPPPERRGLERRWVALAAVAVLLAAAIALAFLLRDGDDDGADTGGGGEISDQLVFAADGRIFTTGADGSDEVDLTRGRRGDAQPDWSPDGERIALARAGDIWVIDASGENARPLTSGGEQDAAPDWSPDGTRIAFDRAKRRAGNGTHDVWVMSADGARQSNLTARTGESGAQPDWSPDGTQILFQRKGAMWTMRTDGSAQRRLPLALPGSVHEPVWSPDGTEIAFALASAGTSDIHVYVVDDLGRTVRNLTDGRVTRPRFASWSSDGEQIVFAAEDGIWTIGRDGGGLTRLTQGKNLTAPSWRPRQG